MIETERLRVIQWFVGSDTGLSSECLAAAMVGAKPDSPRAPGDVADLGRCIRLMALFPEWTFDRFARTMSAVSYEWRCLIEDWPEISSSYEREKKGPAPKTYTLMRAAQRRALETDPEVEILGRSADGDPNYWRRKSYSTMKTTA